MLTILLIIYLTMMGVAIGNWLLIKRPRGSARPNFEVMIPARDEALNMERVVTPLVVGGVRVTVYDDESTDETASIARDSGAKVLHPKEPLPQGWTGKNNACHQLSLVATESWTVFLDADTIPSKEFVPRLSAFLHNCPTDISVVTGFPKMIPGKGIEPAYLTWVSWILLATNPFALVSRTKMGHNRFTNGQFSAWRTNALQEIKPFEAVKSEVLEDVKIGRLLHKLKQQVEVIDMSEILSVKMYQDVRTAIDGMSKNSGDIMGNAIQSILLSALLVIIAWGWLWFGYYGLIVYGILVLGKLVTDRAVGAPLWIFPIAPITITAGALTIIRSLIWKRKGSVVWKGRNY